MDSVLDSVIDDALLFSEQKEGSVLDMIDVIQSGNIENLNTSESVLPACQRIADSKRYHRLFMDPQVSDYILHRIANHEGYRCSFAYGTC